MAATFIGRRQTYTSTSMPSGTSSIPARGTRRTLGLLHDKRLGNAVTDLRHDRGLSQSDVKGISARHLRRIEEGESTPRLATLRRLAEAHGLPLNEYLGELGRRANHARPGREGTARDLKLGGELRSKGELDELRGREPRSGSDLRDLKGLLSTRKRRRVTLRPMQAAVSRQGRRRP